MITKIETRRDGNGKEIIEQKHNHLAPAEMMSENNYNQINGVLDNTSKPTFEERMKAATAKAKEHNNRKIERHRKSRHGNKAERHKRERH